MDLVSNGEILGTLGINEFHMRKEGFYCLVLSRSQAAKVKRLSQGFDSVCLQDPRETFFPKDRDFLKWYRG